MSPPNLHPSLRQQAGSDRPWPDIDQWQGQLGGLGGPTVAAPAKAPSGVANAVIMAPSPSPVDDLLTSKDEQARGRPLLNRLLQRFCPFPDAQS